MSERGRWRLAILMLVGLGSLAYSNCFTGLFLGLDARESIRDNLHIRSMWPLSEAMSLPLWGSVVVADQHATVAFRPVYSLILATCYAAVGIAPWVFHGVNLGLHIAAGVAMFGFVRRAAMQVQGSVWTQAEATWLALAAASLWIVHPIQTESVTYFAQIAEVAMGCFMFLTLYCAIRAVGSQKRRHWHIAAFVAGTLSIGSKQTAVVLPLLLIAFDHVVRLEQRTARYRPSLYAAMVVPIAVSTLVIAGDASESVNAKRAIAFMLAQPSVILHYLRLVLWPDQLYLYVNTTQFDVDSFSEAILPAIPLVGLFVATCWALLRRHWLGFLGAWFFLTLAPTSSFLPITDTIQEHRMYVPLAALAVLAVVAGNWLVGRLVPLRLGPTGLRAVRLLVLVAVLAALGARTYARNWDYHHEFAPIHPADLHENYRILADHARSRPDILALEVANARATLAAADPHPLDVPYAHFILGIAAAENGDFDAAIRALRRVVDLAPDFAYAHHQLGIAYHESRDLPAAREHLETAIRLEPRFVYPLKDLAIVLADAGDRAAARAHLERALAIRPGFAEAHHELGMMALDAADAAAAEAHFRQAIDRRPDLCEARVELARLLSARGNRDAARQQLHVALRFVPDCPAAADALDDMERRSAD